MSKNDSLKRSPFFYVGDKFKLIGEIKDYFPKKINKFVEPFLGGGSVFLNTDANQFVLNDIDENVIALHSFLKDESENEKAFLDKVKKILKKYNLSRSVFEDVVPSGLKKEWKKTYYAEYNRKGYGNLKADYNKAKKKDFLILYLLLIYGFNRILRFNKKGEFNIPVGNVDFNKNVSKAIKDYFSFVSCRNITFTNKDFKDFFKSIKLTKDDFVYVDPPYLISASEYNKLWGEKQELELLALLDDLDKKGIKFALSNVTSYKGMKNQILSNWIKKYNVIKISSNYISYHNNKKKDIIEVLITNY